MALISISAKQEIPAEYQHMYEAFMTAGKGIGLASYKYIEPAEGIPMLRATFSEVDCTLYNLNHLIGVFRAQNIEDDDLSLELVNGRLVLTLEL